MILGKKMSNDKNLELNVVFSRKKSQVTRSLILLKETESEQKTCELASALGGFQYLVGHEFRKLAFQTNSK